MISSLKRRRHIGAYLAGAFALGLILLTSGCGRGRPSEEAPIHLVPNMDDQPRYEVQGQSQFFANGMADRLPVEGTIARGYLVEDIGYQSGRNGDGQLLAKAPVPVTLDLLNRGRQRYDIYCSPCHGRVGDGQGAVGKRGMLPPPTFHDERLIVIEDGHFFETMTKGKGNMPSYAYQVPVPDRWAIVVYIRALQRSQNASSEDLPPDTTQSVEVSETQ